MSPLTQSRAVVALVASLAAHLAIVLAAARTRSAPQPDSVRLGPDNWTGETFEIGDLPAQERGWPEGPAAHPGNPPPAPEASEPTAGTVPAVTAKAATTNAAPAPPASRAGASRSRPVRRSVAASTSTSVGEGESATTTAGGRFGMQGQPGVRDLSRAFTRAVPIAISGDPIWSTIPMGPAGNLDLTLTLGDDGRIISAVPDRHAADHLRSIGSRTVALLGAGTFAIGPAGGPGVQVLRLSVVVSSVGASPPDDHSIGPYGLGFEPPWEGKPGRAFFTLRSGRHVEVSVRVMPVQ